MQRHFSIAFVSILIAGLTACGKPAVDPGVSAPDEAPSETAEQFDASPAPTTGQSDQAMAGWPHGAMVAAADPRAVNAGLEVLAAGGNAIDAAIAVHAVLGLVEPQSSGLGGGAFMVYYDRAEDRITVFDGREVAPDSVDENLFVENGEVLGFIDAWQSGLSTGVPGAVALYEAAHTADGALDWAQLFAPAIRLAADGFAVSPRLAGLLANERYRQFVRLDDRPESAAYFYPDGTPLAEGTVQQNPAYAALLGRIASEGASAFYTGKTAQAILDAVGEAPRPGAMTLEDLAGYEVKTREAVCGAWRDYRICSAPPPSSGGITQIMIPNLYDRLLPAEPIDEDQLTAFVDAQRLAYADRDHYVADADFVPVPTDLLIDPAYLDARAGDRFAPGGKSFPGDPGAIVTGEAVVDLWGRDTTEDAPGTTHISIIDQNGNAVSMTATVEAGFGNSRLVSGFLLNNEMTDFARDPRKNGKPVANAPAGGKRPRSSMSPTLIFDGEGNLKMVTGSPGGNSIVAYTAKTVLGVLDWGMTAQQAISLPNVIARGDQVGVETGQAHGEAIAETLREKGYEVRPNQGEGSGLHTIVVREDGLEGGADPRREGVARKLDAGAPARDDE